MISKGLEQVKKNYGAPWYLPVISLVTAANVFMVFLPVEAILVGGILFRPKTWAKTAFWQTLAATAATLVLGLLVVWKGHEALNWIAPNVENSPSWLHWTQMMRDWGLWALVVISILPVPTLPGIAFAVFAKMPFFPIFYAVLAGRAIKFYGLCFMAAYFPQKFRKHKIST